MSTSTKPADGPENGGFVDRTTGQPHGEGGRTHELQILLMLATQSPQEVAFKLSGGYMSGRTIRGWMGRLAADLDAAGYNGNALRSLLKPERRRPRITRFTDLEGDDRRSARRKLSAAELAPAPCDPGKAGRSFRNLIFMADGHRERTSSHGYPPKVVHEGGLWRMRYGLMG